MYYVIAWKKACRLQRMYLWAKILHRDFAHVFALKWAGDQWLMVHPRIGYLEVQALPYYDERDIDQIVEEMEIDYTYKVGFEKLDKNRYRTPWLLGVWSCTEVIKALLGIRALWVFTPKQLYKYLKQRH